MFVATSADQNFGLITQSPRGSGWSGSFGNTIPDSTEVTTTDPKGMYDYAPADPWRKKPEGEEDGRWVSGP